MSSELEQLNNAPPEIARARFLDCCGSREWAQKMVQARGFADSEELLNEAEKIWQSLEPKNWLEAFAAHPKIGERKASANQQAQAAEWSQTEQSGTRNANELVLDALEEANRLYEEKFGFIFIVCATGKSAEEMLEICRRRLNNEPDAEMRIAAEEQNKITKIRLQKLLQTEIK